MHRRRTFLAGCTSILLGGAVLNGKTRWERSRQKTSSIESGPSIDVDVVAEGLTQPLGLGTVPGANLRYIADQTGRIFVHGPDGVLPDPLLDVTDQLVEPITWEQGLLGFELHPEFETTHRYYVRYSAPTRPGTPDEYSHTFVLSEFTATEDLRRTIPDSERTILEIPEQGPNHNAGAIEFGPDGYLYVAVGDGNSRSGDRGRGHANDWYLLNGGGNGQDVTDNLRGSILRLDVDERDGDTPYAIPPDNPLVGSNGLDEQYAWGFRNPYRMGFDGDDLLVGDVGENRYEEINRVRSGGNYGWNVREGTRCYSNRLPIRALAKLPGVNQEYPGCPTTTRTGAPLLDPVISYAHPPNPGTVKVAVIAGYGYYNEAIPALTGKYIFGDLKQGLFAATPLDPGDGLWPIETLRMANSASSSFDGLLLSIERDHDGELYCLTSQLAPDSGKLLKLVSPES